jgi:phospholipid transport system substrate-binding protein
VIVRQTAAFAAAAAALAWLTVPPALSLLRSLAFAAAWADASEVGPREVMEDVSKRMFAALDGNRAAIRKDPEKVYPLVDQILLPHFDTEYAAELVLARYWRTATPEQRKHFGNSLYRALLRTYGGALTEVTADRLKLLPFGGDPAGTEGIVRTQVTRSNGAGVLVDYRLRRTADGWKVFDVIIEGISLVRTFRADFDGEIKRDGLDAVISRIEKHGLDHKEPAAGEVSGTVGF